MAYVGRPPANAPLTSADIPDGIIVATDLIDDAITADKLASNSVVNASIVNGTIEGGKIANNAITSAHLGLDVIVAEDIANNAITVAEIQDDAVTADKLANSINTAIAANTAKVSFTPDAAQSFNDSGADVDFVINSSDPNGENIFFVDGAGPRIYIKHNASVNLAGANRTIGMHHTEADNTNGIGIFHWAGANSSRGNISFAKSLGTSPTSADPYNEVTSTRPLGAIEWYGADGDSFELGAKVEAFANQTWTDSAHGTYMCFFTTDDNTTTVDERIRIAANGVVTIGGNPSLTNGCIGLSDNKVEIGAKGDVGGKRISYLDNYLWIDAGANGIKFDGYATGTLSVDASDIVTSSSDGRMKNEAGEIEDGLSVVNGLLPRYYYWKKNPDGPKELGFFSQEVNSVLPEAGTKKAKLDSDGNPILDSEGNQDYQWGIYDRALIAVLTKAVQELSTKVTALESA